YLFIIGLFVIAVGVAWILTGGPGGDMGFPSQATPTPLPTPESMAGTVTPAPVQGTLPPSGPGDQAASAQAQPITTIAPVTAASPILQPTQQISSDDIKLHFM